MGSVYVILNLPKGRIYVGSAKVWRIRLREHESMLIRGKHPNRFLQNDWSKTSPHDWRFLVLEDGIPEDLLLAHEQVYLSKVFDGQDRCYNIMPLARKNSLGVKRGQETKDRISKANSGKKRSPEQNLRMRELKQKLKGKKVWQYTTQGVLLGWFPGLREAENLTKVKRPSITDHLKGEILHAGGFLWTLDPEGKDIPEKVTRYQGSHGDFGVTGFSTETGEPVVFFSSPQEMLAKYPKRSLFYIRSLCDPSDTGYHTFEGLAWRKAGERFDLDEWRDLKEKSTTRGFHGRHSQETKNQISRKKGTPVEGLNKATGHWTWFHSVKAGAQASGNVWRTVKHHCELPPGEPKKMWRWAS